MEVSLWVLEEQEEGVRSVSPEVLVELLPGPVHKVLRVLGQQQSPQ